MLQFTDNSKPIFIRETVAHEVALKISETSYLPVRSYGMEQILHGPKITLDNESSIIAFTSSSQSRQDSLREYADVVGAEFIEINDAQNQLFPSSSEGFNWLVQLVWGQQLALELAKRVGTNPDTVRKDQGLYANAGKDISL
jgi:fructoselysine-6-P-deglycase FrlB-like protein